MKLFVMKKGIEKKKHTTYSLLNDLNKISYFLSLYVCVCFDFFSIECILMKLSRETSYYSEKILKKINPIEYNLFYK